MPGPPPPRSCDASVRNGSPPAPGADAHRGGGAGAVAGSHGARSSLRRPRRASGRAARRLLRVPRGTHDDGLRARPVRDGQDDAGPPLPRGSPAAEAGGRPRRSVLRARVGPLQGPRRHRGQPHALPAVAAARQGRRADAARRPHPFAALPGDAAGGVRGRGAPPRSRDPRPGRGAPAGVRRPRRAAGARGRPAAARALYRRPAMVRCGQPRVPRGPPAAGGPGAAAAAGQLPRRGDRVQAVLEGPVRARGRGTPARARGELTHAAGRPRPHDFAPEPRQGGQPSVRRDGRARGGRQPVPRGAAHAPCARQRGRRHDRGDARGDARSPPAPPAPGRARVAGDARGRRAPDGRAAGPSGRGPGRRRATGDGRATRRPARPHRGRRAPDRAVPRPHPRDADLAARAG